MKHPRPPYLRILARALRKRCPRCGGGAIFSTDFDCEVDLWAYWRMFNRMIGGRSGVPPRPECYERFDVDGDGEIDLHDFAVFSIKFTSPD